MIGIAVVAHGDLATSLVNTVQMFVGESPKLVGINLAPDSGPDTFIHDLREKTKDLDDGDGVLILADLYGGTPGNSALRIIHENKDWTAITGVNLTMLLEAVLSRNNCKDVFELCELAIKSSHEGIQKLSTIVSNSSL